MKKTLLFFMGCTLLAIGCQKTSLTEVNSTDGNIVADAPASFGRHCASYEVLQRQIKEDPSLLGRMQAIEEATERFASNPDMARLVNGVYEIPVVVNVLYKTAAENISDAQIASQIAVLNADFGGTNTDISLIPATFTGVKAGNINIRFVLSQTIRKSTTKTSWSTNDAVKKTASGGLNPTNPTTSLNLWCCNLGNGILGYAQFPGGSSATDGVVIDNNAFGSTGTVTSPYNKGRTGTHEVGHWLNLRHIWGDATCGSDLVGDTPTHNTANYSCPASGHRSTCTGTPIEMTMNYMDYTNDACMYMFSAGQKTRMLATFATGGGRTTFAAP